MISGKKLLFVINVDKGLVSHRLPIAEEAVRQGYDVHLASGMTDQQSFLEGKGITLHPLNMVRGKASLLSYIKNIIELYKLFRKLKPDLVHLVTIKPVLFGGLVARFTGVPKVVAAISGLGYVFLAQGLRAWVKKIIVLFVYRFALVYPRVTVIFQNVDDQNMFINKIGLPEAQAVLIHGSGVDLHEYQVLPEPDGDPVVVLPSRLLVDKGVREFVEAARLLKSKMPRVRFCLVGNIDLENPASLTQIEVEGWVKEGVVEAWGYRADMPDVFAQAHLVVLPSYREGLPKALIEAAACGRAVVTTDVPGCRDAISSGETGVLAEVKNPHDLARAMEWLLIDSFQRQEMGKAGRIWAEKMFDINDVVCKHLNIYKGMA